MIPSALRTGRRSDRNCEPKAVQAKRVSEAKVKLRVLLSDVEGPHFFLGDSEFKEMLGLSEPVVRKERISMDIPPRDERIYRYLLPLKPDTMFLDEMVLKCGGRVDYHCLYHILKKRKVSYPRRNK